MDAARDDSPSLLDQSRCKHAWMLLAMSVLATILAAAQGAGEHAKAAEHSEVPFFVAGSLLALWALTVSVFGFMRPDFPSSEGAARGVMGLSAAFVLAAVSMAIYVAL
jgi:hypothetical protein